MAAFATLVASDDYALGALCLARSLRRVESRHPLLVLADPEVVGLDALEAEGCRIVPVEPLPLSDGFRGRHARAALHGAAPFTKGGKPAFHDPIANFTKLRLWQLAEHEQIVFLDADTVVLRPIDRLMGYPEFVAAPNLYASMADMRRMNSGVFVMRPDPRTFERMLARLDAPDAFWRRTDQTFLEAFWPGWHGLPYLDNCLQYVFLDLPELWDWPAIRVLHYQYEKPWDHGHARAKALKPLIDVWWSLLEGRELPAALPAG